MFFGRHQRIVRSTALAGYILACLVAGFAHDHAPGMCCSASGGCEATEHESQAAAPRCRHSHHHGHSHSHGGQQCRHESQKSRGAPRSEPGECPHPDKCAACQWLAQCPLPVTLVVVEQVAEFAPHVPAAHAIGSVADPLPAYLARGPPGTA